MDSHEDDHVDMAELEANLYAQIHHDAPESVEQFSAEAKMQQQQQHIVSVPVPNRVVTSSSVVNNNTTSGGGPKKGRYWDNGVGALKPKTAPYTRPANPQSTTKERGKSSPAAPPSIQQATVTVDNRPKPFTPYTSYLSQIGSTPVSMPSTNPTLPQPEIQRESQVPSVASLTHAEIRIALKRKNKQMRKKQQQMNKNSNNPDRRPNPFNRLVENRIQNVQKLRSKKERAVLASSRLPQSVETIDLDSDENLDDDDVICVPVPPPPLVCLDTSDDDDEEQSPEEQIEEVNPVADVDEIAEDFIEQKDRYRMSQNDAFGGLDDSEIDFISTVDQVVNAAIGGKEFSTIDSEIRLDITPTCSTATISTTPDDSREDPAVFATPKRSTSKTTYEVSENGFAAVDIYESESSDFPDSIYERGKRKENFTTDDLFDSDISDIELNIENRLKRRSKRKSCSSNKGSDYMTCSEDEEGDNSDVEIQPAFIESIRGTSTPCVQRGAAVASSKTKIVRPPTASAKRNKRKSITEHSSDEEFVSMLSCIVHDDKNDTNDSSGEYLSQDLIGARALVEQTLKKVTEKKNATEGTVKRTSNWVVTDEVAGDSDANVTKQSIPEKLVLLDSIGETDPIPCILIENDEANGKEMVANDKEEGGDESNDNDKSVPSCSLIVDNPELCWNDEVRSFYNKSWGGENHDQAAIYRGLSKNRLDWKIADEDLFPSTPQTSRRFNARNMRCNNCREKGHRLNDCPQPPKPIRCHMCGEPGHRESRCPNTICLRCGNKTNVFTRGCQQCLPMANMQCHLCKVKGHVVRDCPDKWRRYHSTRKPNNSLEQVPFINKQKYCCVCASAGHLAEYCRHALRIMDNPAQPIKIRSYLETYQRLPAADLKPDGSQLDEVAPFVFMCEPQEHYKFNWDVNESPDRVYGRVIRATQMERTQFKRISKKRRISANEKEQKTKSRRKSKDEQTGQTTLVLNPLNVVKNYKLPKHDVQVIHEPVVEMAMEVVPDSIAVNKIDDVDENNIDDEIQSNMKDETQSPAIHDSSAMTPSNNIPIQVTNKVADNVEDAFLKILDIAAIDEAIRVHEQSLNTAHTNEPKSDTSTMSNFNFVSALSEVEAATKTFVIAALQTNTTTEDSQIITAQPHNESAQSANFSFVTALDETEKNIEPTSVSSTFVNTTMAEVRLKTPPPPNISFSSISVSETKEICAEMQRLEKQEQILNDLKDTLKSKKRTKRVSERVSEVIEDAVGYHVELNEDIEKASAAQKNIPEYDSDSNYSFSDYFAKQQNQETKSKAQSQQEDCEIQSVEDSVKMPDFIPIGGDDEDGEDVDLSFIETALLGESSFNQVSVAPEKGPSKPIAPEDITQYSEAKIFLTKDHSKYLLTRSGGAFLTETYTKHNVVVRMEWRNIGNILIVQGMQSAQDKFHADLIAYCTSAEEEIRKKQEISQQVPKNRLTLIRFIKEQISQLEKQLGNVKECFMRLKISEQQRSKTGTKNADKARRTLNMILLGQTGLRDGTMHLTALQSNLRCLIENETKDSISNAFRNEVYQHFKYIFSSYAHDDYADLVAEYEKMRKAKQLPVLRLDRRLLGIKIDVTKPTALPAPTLDSEELQRNEEYETVLSSMSKSAGGHVPRNQVTPKQDPPPTNLPINLDEGTIKNIEKQTKPEEQSGTVVQETSARNSYVPGPDTLPSKIWSMKCSEYIEKCKAIPKIKSNEKAMDKLRQVEVKAKSGAMSYNDFRMLMRIFDKCQ